MVRTKKGGGGSRRASFLAETGKQQSPMAANQCDAKLNPRKIFLKRKRKDGSTYNLVLEKGERCPNEAVISKRVGGKTVHRCANHIGGY